MIFDGYEALLSPHGALSHLAPITLSTPNLPYPLIVTSTSINNALMSSRPLDTGSQSKSHGSIGWQHYGSMQRSPVFENRNSSTEVCAFSRGGTILWKLMVTTRQRFECCKLSYSRILQSPLVLLVIIRVQAGLSLNTRRPRTSCDGRDASDAI